ncbi:hypothetical protein AQUCO_05800036v1 [Aquilegia coerulea]|uniref:Chromatin assembly factor 1 subunit FAS1 n=1 Tax=Aquilegia coerulea TaxID=218851 RepID=A0A2G5CEB9_AQUCA|nr:hypothetical protein AQUCO_05800036v1 [Aquilegia coerulea]
MGDAMVIDVDGSKQIEQKVKKSKKRKLDSFLLENENKETRINELKKELDGLFKYFKEVSCEKVKLEETSTSSSPCTLNSVIACLLEESELPYSNLVEKIYDKVKDREGITLASVRASVLSVGQRSMYGIANADADILEDTSENCLWCWETRDMKHIPKAQRGFLTVRRTFRKKIHDRISAVSAALQELDIHPTQKHNLMKASEKLVKVLNEVEIRKFVENMVQKSGVELAEKEAKLKEKVFVKELEKEKKRMEREHLKEKLQIEKEKRRLQDEAEKEEKVGDAEKKKINKRQQEGDQRRREKEEAQLKEQLSLKKQASLMERFFKKKTTNSGHQDDISSSKDMISDSPGKGDIKIGNAVTLSMDATFSLKDDMDSCDLYRLHRDAWNKLGCSIHSGDSRHWGMRQKPKIPLIKELKLQGSSSGPGASEKLTTANSAVCGDMLNVEKAVDGLVDNIPDDRLCLNNGDRLPTDIQICNRTKKLLQFDKSHRPAYYGTLSAKSNVIGPRHPLRKDPNLDYDVESDEEWEEEDPGESLSDCDKDEEEESLVEGIVRADDEGSEDGFLVPDGYLSENEGVQVDSKKTDLEDDPGSTPQCKQDSESEELRALFRQQKHIHNLTEQALQKNQPLIVSNLLHEKTTLLSGEDLSGTLKLEQLFLQALSLQPFPGGTPIEISADHNTIEEDQDIQESHCSGGNASGTPVANLLDKDLSKIVSCIQACSNGINNIIESLQQSFPASPKTQLRNKVREIADFVDNRWQVKKEILEKLGLSASPEKSGERTRGIAAFFSKRCLPPTGDPIKMDQISPHSCHKPEMRFHE